MGGMRGKKYVFNEETINDITCINYAEHKSPTVCNINVFSVMWMARITWSNDLQQPRLPYTIAIFLALLRLENLNELCEADYVSAQYLDLDLEFIVHLASVIHNLIICLCKNGPHRTGKWDSIRHQTCSLSIDGFYTTSFRGCRSPTPHLHNCIAVHFIVIFRVFKELNQSWFFLFTFFSKLCFLWLPMQVSPSFVLSLRNWVLKNHYQPSLLRLLRWVSCEAYVSQGLDCIWIWYWLF